MAEDILMVRIEPRAKQLLRLRAARELSTMSELARDAVVAWLGNPTPEERIFLAESGNQNHPTERTDAPATEK